MKIKQTIKCGTIAMLLTMASSASAQQQEAIATLGEFEGTVLVNRGENYIPATEGMELFPGDRLLTRDDSRAPVNYADGCTLTVSEQSLLTLQTATECTEGIASLTSTEAIGAGTGTLAGTTGMEAGALVAAGSFLGIVGGAVADTLDDEEITPEQ